MFFTVDVEDIPKMTNIEVIEYKILTEQNADRKVYHRVTDRFIALIFLAQANRFAELSKGTEFEKAALNYERMALINFQAYLERG